MTITSIETFMEFVYSLDWASKEGSHSRAWFRGHADATWKLTPGVYRSTFGVYTDDKARLKRERQLSQEFFVRSGNLLPGPRTDVELYFLQQHFGMPTRLLDWTGSPLVALYFAVWSKEHRGVMGSVAALDAYKFNGSRGHTGSRGFKTSRDKELIDSIGRITLGNNKLFPNRILPVRPTHIEMRMSLQRAGFTFHVPKRAVLDETDNETLRVATIPADDKEKLRKQLLNLGIDAASIYGDLAGLAVALKDSYGIDRY